MSAATCNFRWWDNNGITPEAITAGRVTFSSENASFPASNAGNENRSKVWAFGGNFEITSANQKIYIGAGSADIPVGFYTGATLASAIQSALNGIDSNWTAAYSTSTYKFTISNSGSKTLELSSTSSAIWDTLGYIGTTDRVGTSFVADEIRIHTDEWVKIDFVAGFPIDVCGIISLLGEQFPLSSNATITLQADNVDLWTNPALEVSLSRTPRGVFHFIDGDYTELERTYRWARIKIVDRTNPLGATGIKISRVYIGSHSTTSTNIGAGFSKPISDPSSVQRSDSGVPYFEEKIKYQQIQGATYAVIAQADRLLLEQLYQDFGRTKALFVSIDPQGNISDGLQEFTYYGHFLSDPTPRSLFRDKWAWQFNFRETA